MNESEKTKVEFGDLSESEQSLVDSRLDEYVATLRRGEPTSLHGLLEGLSETARHLMLREAFLEKREFERERLDQELVRSFSDCEAFSESIVDLDSSPVNQKSSAPKLTPDQLPKLANYELLEVLGVGGTSRVFLASHHRLRRPVALKCPLTRAQSMNSEQLVRIQRRFQREARIQAQVASPGVPAIFEVDWTLDELPIIAMEPVLGPTFEEKLTNRTLQNLDRVNLENVARVCRTLAIAHQQEVLHLDLKPQNIRFTSDGLLKILDWGFGREPHDELADGVEGGDNLPPMTGLGGTPYYMAPEQARGDWESLSNKTDTFAVGAILYEVLTNNRIFPANSPTRDLLSMTSKGEFQDAIAYLKEQDLPEELSRLTIDCLAFQQDSRPAVEDVAAAIESYFAGVDESDRKLREEALVLKENQKRIETERKLRSRTTMVVAGAFLSILLLGTLLYVGSLWRNAESLKMDAETAKAVAEDAKDSAEVARQTAESAEKAERDARNKLIKADAIRRVALAYEKWKEQEIELARELLIECPTDLRNWEWRYVNRLCNPERLTIQAHQGGVFAVAMNRKRIISCGLDGFVRGWDSQSGKQVYEIKYSRFSNETRLDKNSQIPRRAAVSIDGKLIATATHDNDVQIWDGLTGEKLQLIPKPPDEETQDTKGQKVIRKNNVFGLAIASRSKPVLVVSRLFSTTLYHPKTGDVISQLPASTHVSISSPSLHVAMIFDFFAWSAMIFDVRQEKFVKQLQRNNSMLSTLEMPKQWVVSPLGTELAEFSNFPFDVRVSDYRTDQIRFKLVGHSGPVHSVCYSPLIIGSGWRIATGSEDGTAKIWSGNDGRLLANFAGHSGAVVCTAFDTSAKWLVTGGNDGKVKIWNSKASPREVSHVFGELQKRNNPAIENIVNETVLRKKVIATSSDGTRVIRSGYITQKDFLIDSLSGKSIVELPFKHIRGKIMFGRSSEILLRAHVPKEQPCRIEVYSGKTGKLISSLDLTDEKIPSVLEISPDEQQVIFSNEQQGLSSWDFRKNLVSKLSQSSKLGPFGAIRFSADGKNIAAIPKAGNLYVFDLPGNRVLFQDELGPQRIAVMEFTKNGEGLVILNTQGQLMKWKVESGKNELKVATGFGDIKCGKLDRSGERIALAHGREIKVLDLQSGEVLTHCVGHSRTVRVLDFNSDGTRIVSGGDDKDVLVWDVETGVQTLRLRGHEGSLTHLVFGENDDWILSASYGLLDSSERAMVWEARERVE